MVVQPGGLEPELVVLEEVRVVRGQWRIRWSLRATIDAARPEALRHGRVHHVVRIKLIGQVEFGCRAVLPDLFGQVDTRAAEDAGRQAPGAIGVTGAIGLEGGRQLARMRTVDVVEAEAEEAVQGVVVAEEAVADGAGEIGHDVVAQLAEHRVVAVDADLVGEP